MTSQQRETALICILQALEAAYPHTMAAREIMTPLRLSGMREIGERDLDGLLATLVEKQWIAESRSPAAAEIKRFALKEAGRVYLRDIGL